MLKRFLRGVNTLLIVLYPILLYITLPVIKIEYLAAGLAVLFGLRWLLQTHLHRIDHLTGLLGILFCLYAGWRNNPDVLRFYPVLINLGLLFLFGHSLKYPPTIIERLARLQHPDLPPEGIHYTRRVTQVWCVFFLLNGLMAFITAVWGSFALWTLYNGVIAYFLMGLLMAVEYLIRLKTQKHVR